MDFQIYKDNLSEELSNMFHYIFDIRVMNNAPVSFNLPVFKEGYLLFSRDDVLRTDLMEACSLVSIQDDKISFQYLREIVF